MFKVSIKKQNIETHGAKFETLEEVNAWIQQCESAQAWGRPDRWVRDNEFTPLNNEEKARAAESRLVVIQEAVPEYVNENGETVPAIPEKTVTEYFFPAEYTIEIQDITAEILYEKEIQKRINRINFGTRIFAELTTRNVIRLKAGTTTVEALLIAEEKLAKVQRLMANSSTETALQTLVALDIPEIPNEEKTLFVAKIQEYLQKE